MLRSLACGTDALVLPACCLGRAGRRHRDGGGHHRGGGGIVGLVPPVAGWRRNCCRSALCRRKDPWPEVSSSRRRRPLPLPGWGRGAGPGGRRVWRPAPQRNVVGRRSAGNHYRRRGLAGSSGSGTPTGSGTWCTGCYGRRPAGSPLPGSAGARPSRHGAG
jgi:hypothetical protein